MAGHMEISNDQKSHTYRARPEPGQLVEVRRRQWVVADVASSKLESDSASQNCVKLSSIDEDGLGEELEVIWEIEPGAQIIERAGLPSITGQDDSNTLEAFLDALRWGAATNADRGFLHAPFRSGVSIEDFQLDPLVRAIDMARVNLLIADDVGLGKTIEAGLVIQEMLMRHRARTFLIVCPASLQEKWRLEMLQKFGLEFQIVDTPYVKALRRERGIHANPWTAYPRLITSMDWAKSGEGLRAMADVLPSNRDVHRKFDMLIVDEAHNIAPSASTHYALESQRTRFIRRISPHFQHRLFLTATPHNGYTESFTSLLELLDDQRFARNILPKDKQLSQVMVRRLKSSILNDDGTPRFPQRNLQALKVEYSDAEREIHAKLKAYCESREKSAGGNAFGTTFVNQLLRKRLFSSPAAFATTLDQHMTTLTQGKAVATNDSLSERILRKAILRVEEDYADDQEVESAHIEAVEEASRYVNPLTADQQQMLQELRGWAQKARHQPDSKALAVLNWLTTYLKSDGQWNERRVILFTEYRTTHQWLQEILVHNGYGGDRLSILHGGMDHDEREEVKAAFQASPQDSSVRILLATDAASEGIDLQNFCNYLIHLEIPYNPNVMEQRNGRIDRHGQRQSEVLIWHPVDAAPKGQMNIGGHGEDILRSLKKLESMRADMGSVNPVIAPQLAGLIEGTRTELNTRAAEELIAKARPFVQADRAVKERVSKIMERRLETEKDFHMSAAHILAAVQTGLALADKPALEPLNWPEAPEGSVFRVPQLAGSWGRCAEGLEHPFHKGRIRPITFDHAVAQGRDDIVLAHMNHRLVQMCLRLLRAEVWSPAESQKLHRVSVRTLPDLELTEPAVVVVSRLVITGGNHHRMHEELTYSGGYLRDQSFRREEGVARIQQWMEAGTAVRVSDAQLKVLRQRFERSQEGVWHSVQVRAKDRLKSLTNILQSRKQQELEDISAVLTELQVSIEAELKKSREPAQLSLFSEDERTQLRRDNVALEARLARIPKEQIQEMQSIEERYSKLDDRIFPVAVILLLPESQVGGLTK
jgi:superfamily II DNA/RNA helicase